MERRQRYSAARERAGGKCERSLRSICARSPEGSGARSNHGLLQSPEFCAERGWGIGDRGSNPSRPVLGGEKLFTSEPSCCSLDLIGFRCAAGGGS